MRYSRKNVTNTRRSSVKKLVSAKKKIIHIPLSIRKINKDNIIKICDFCSTPTDDICNECKRPICSIHSLENKSHQCEINKNKKK